MIRLVRVELTRLRWRRAVVLLVLAAVAVPMVILAARAYETRPVSDAERAEAQVQVDAERDYRQQGIERCQRRGKASDQACERRFDYEVSIDNYLYREQLRLGDERSASGLSVVAVLAVLVLLVGTTYVGHDWGSGSMSNQLLFEPRRLRVWAAKALAVGLLALLLSVVVLTVFWGAMALLAQSRGTGPSSQVVVDVAQHAARGTVLVVVAALAGYALTTLSRSTVFTVGALAVVAVAGGLLFGAVLPDEAQRFEPASNAVALVDGRLEYFVQPADVACVYDTAVGPGDCDGRRVLTQVDGAAYYGVLLLVLGGASAASYRRRDVP